MSASVESPVTARYALGLRAAMLAFAATFAATALRLDRLERASSLHLGLYMALVFAVSLGLETRRRITVAGEALCIVGLLRTRRYEVAQVRALRRREVIEPTGVEIELDDGFVTFLPEAWTGADALRAALLHAREAAPYREAGALPVTDAPIVLAPARPSGLRGLIADLAYLGLFALLALLAGSMLLLGWFVYRDVSRALWCVAAVVLFVGGLASLGSGLRTSWRLHARGAIELTREGLRVGPAEARRISWSEVVSVEGRCVHLRDGASVPVNRDEASVVRAAQARYATAECDAR
ncbi:MAG: hypothetical protein R3A48_25485 [Polyangiales bacterium]